MSNETIEADFSETEPSAVMVVEKNDFMPALTPEEGMERVSLITEFVREAMKENVDFGAIPGTTKKTLLKAGAEKLTTLFGLSTKFVDEKVVENFDDEDPFFYYRRKCQLWRGNLMIAEASGSCNSKEKKFRWRWVKEHEVPKTLKIKDLETRKTVLGAFAWQIESADTKYKTAEEWARLKEAMEAGETNRFMKEQPWNGKEEVYHEIEDVLYRVPNEEIFDMVNTYLKMADKRALVAATLIAVNASDFFTQDLEDIGLVDIDEEVGKATEHTVEEAITYAYQKVSEGTFPENKYLAFAVKLDFDADFANGVLTDFKADDKDVNDAVLHLIDRYVTTNSMEKFLEELYDDL